MSADADPQNSSERTTQQIVLRVLGQITFAWSVIRFVGDIRTPELLAQFVAGILPTIGNFLLSIVNWLSFFSQAFDWVVHEVQALLGLDVPPGVLPALTMLLGLCVPMFVKNWSDVRRNPSEYYNRLQRIIFWLAVAYVFDYFVSYAGDPDAISRHVEVLIHKLLVLVIAGGTLFGLPLMVLTLMNAYFKYVHPVVIRRVRPRLGGYELMFTLFYLGLYVLSVLGLWAMDASYAAWENDPSFDLQGWITALSHALLQLCMLGGIGGVLWNSFRLLSRRIQS